MSNVVHQLERMIFQARNEYAHPEDATRLLLGMVAAADDDFRDDLAFEFARQSLSAAVRRDTLQTERTASRPNVEASDRIAPRESRSIFEDSDAGLRFRVKVDKTMEDLKSELRLEWTSELLASQFALGDGTFVTWGEATIEQHNARIQMHQTNAQAALEGWARHSQAVDALSEAHVPCLNDLVKE